MSYVTFIYLILDNIFKMYYVIFMQNHIILPEKLTTNNKCCFQPSNKREYRDNTILNYIFWLLAKTVIRNSSSNNNKSTLYSSIEIRSNGVVFDAKIYANLSGLLDVVQLWVLCCLPLLSNFVYCWYWNVFEDTFEHVYYVVFAVLVVMVISGKRTCSK